MRVSVGQTPNALRRPGNRSPVRPMAFTQLQAASLVMASVKVRCIPTPSEGAQTPPYR